VHAFVHETRRDGSRGGRRSGPRHERPPSVRRGRRSNQRRGETAETHVVWLITQRSRVQIPPPLLISAGQGPFPTRRRAFCVPGTVVKRLVGAALRAASRRDGGDEVTRDETTWTRWTLTPAIAGWLAQRYCKCIPVSSHSCWTSRNMRNPGSGQGRQRLVVASGRQSARSAPARVQ
jgi:hypothetical protein